MAGIACSFYNDKVLPWDTILLWYSPEVLCSICHFVSQKINNMCAQRLRFNKTHNITFTASSRTFFSKIGLLFCFILFHSVYSECIAVKNAMITTLVPLSCFMLRHCLPTITLYTVNIECLGDFRRSEDNTVDNTTTKANFLFTSFSHFPLRGFLGVASLNLLL